MLEHQRDLWADFRFAYGLSPAQALELPGPEYLALAWRAPAYQGVLATRLAREQDDRPGSPGQRSMGGPGPEGRDVPLGASRAALVDADGLPLGDLFD